MVDKTRELIGMPAPCKKVPNQNRVFLVKKTGGKNQIIDKHHISHKQPPTFHARIKPREKWIKT